MSMPDEHSVFCDKCNCYNIQCDDIWCDDCVTELKEKTAKELERIADNVNRDFPFKYDKHQNQKDLRSLAKELKQK